MKNKSKFNVADVADLKDYFVEYLDHRLHASIPHLTFKRYLVARDRRDMCDLYDIVRGARSAPQIAAVPWIANVEMQVDLLDPHYMVWNDPKCSWS